MSEREQLVSVVLDYLAAAEERDLPRATALLAEDVEIIFPGGVRHPDLGAVVTAAKGRYRSVVKSIDSIDVDLDQKSVVIAGELAGENLYGVEFNGIRFIDRFELQDGLISRQHVWNDLEESKVLEIGDALSPDKMESSPC